MEFYDQLEQHGANAAIITEGSGPISYAALAAAADGLAGHIARRRVGFLLCENRFESVAGYLGFLRRRAVPVLINSSMDASLFADLFAAYRPAYVYLPAGRASAIPGHKPLATCGGYCLIETACAQDYEVHADLGLLLTTSGSTGSPKLVRLSYKNIGSNAGAIAQYLAIGSDDRPITTMPMSYTFGLSIINSHLLRGAAILMTDATLMDKRFWQTLKEQRATTFGGVPYIFEMLKKLRFARMDLPSLKYLTQAGGKLSSELVAEFAGVCAAKSVKFIVMYGQTEATARMSYLPWEYARTKAGSMGIAIPGGRFWLVDDAGNIIEDAETVGELHYQGDNVSLGYATSCADLSKGDENRGILPTGDMAKRDHDGFYYIVGRKKRFLKLFGNRINLDEAERLLRTAGYDCACAGVDDKLTIYVTRKDQQVQILKTISERTGINPQGFAVVHIEKMPRNESGKIVYSALG
jgi:acyl-coenzyme A synthetase/AMP-(fatty) acid ligase